ncbi:hypothetical protein [Halocatena halophila]|uniref:hypothetical protein n=1 Tax=Halocatena halophila TaxID=2814576 RepID=UPI002ED02A6A
MVTVSATRLRLLCLACFVGLCGLIGIHQLTGDQMAIELAVVLLPVSGAVFGGCMISESSMRSTRWCGWAVTVSAIVMIWLALNNENPFANSLLDGVLITALVSYRLINAIDRPNGLALGRSN